MKGIKFVLLCMILIVLVLVVSGGGSVSAAVVNVNNSLTSAQLQSYLDGASDGDVINFSAGTYRDVQLKINKSLTLVSDTGDYRTSEVVFTGDVLWQVDSSNVTIKGFRFKNTSLMSLQNPNFPILSGMIWVSYPPIGNVTLENVRIEKNKFLNVSSRAIYVQLFQDIPQGSTHNYTNQIMNVSVVDNYYHMPDIPPLRQLNMSHLSNGFASENGVTFAGINRVNGVLIEGNVINNSNLEGIDVQNSENVSILNNRLHNVYGNAINIIRIDNFKIKGNLIHRSGFSRWSNKIKAGLLIDMPFDDDRPDPLTGVVENNTFNENDDALVLCNNCDHSVSLPFVQKFGHGGTAVVEFRNNLFYNNSGSLDFVYSNSGIGQITNASHNYWGPDGPDLSRFFGGSHYSPSRHLYNGTYRVKDYAALPLHRFINASFPHAFYQDNGFYRDPNSNYIVYNPYYADESLTRLVYLRSINVSNSLNQSQVQRILDVAENGSVIDFRPGVYRDMQLRINRPLTLSSDKENGETSEIMFTNVSSVNPINVNVRDNTIIADTGTIPILLEPVEPMSSSSSSGGGGSGDRRVTFTGFNRKKTATASGTVNEGVPFEYDLRNRSLSVREVRMILNKTARNALLTVSDLTRRSTTEKPSGDVYNYFGTDLRRVNERNVERFRVTFAVNKSWLSATGFEKDEVVLLMKDGNEWKELSTEPGTENPTEIEFSADASGPSVFAVTGRKKETEKVVIPETEEVKDDTDMEKEEVVPVTDEGKSSSFWKWFLWVLVAVVVLVVVVVLLKSLRRRYVRGMNGLNSSEGNKISG